MQKNCIYLIKTKTHPERIYVGSAVVFSSRYGLHIKQLREGNHHNNKLQRHVNKYGIDDIYFEIIETTDRDNLIKREQFYIDSFNPFFNICKIAGSCAGRVATEQARRNMSLGYSKRKPMSDETKQKLRLINIGKKLSEETKLKIKLGLVGKKTNKGFKQTDEAKRRISEARKGKKKSPQTIINMIKAQAIRRGKINV